MMMKLIMMITTRSQSNLNGIDARQLSKWHPIALGAAVLDAVVERTGIDASLIDDVSSHPSS